jgi:hypothetical protein
MASMRRVTAGKGWYWRGLFRLATCRPLHGIPAGVFWPAAGTAELILGKVDAALGLIARHDRRRFDRLSRDARGVLVHGAVGGVGTWVQGAGLIVLREDYVLHAGTSPAHLASTIVHESTHAWLCRLGFGYPAAWRARIEAICYRSEMAFVRRLPDGEDLLTELADELARDPAEYSEVARRERGLADLRALGTPEWLVRLVGFATGRRAA